MKKLVAPLLLALAALAFSGQIVLAATTSAPPPGVGPAGQDLLKFLGNTAERGGLTSNAEAATSPTTIVSAIVNTLLGLIGVMFFVQIFYAGFRWMTAEGSEEIIKESKDTIKNSVIGITIVLSAFVLTNFVLNRLERINQSPAATGSSGAATPAPGGTSAPTGGSGSAGGGGAATQTGACYVNVDPGCIMTTASDCAARSGNFQGEGTQC